MSDGYAVSPPAIGTSPVTSAGYRSTETPDIYYVPRSAGSQAAMQLGTRQELIFGALQSGEDPADIAEGHSWPYRGRNRANHDLLTEKI